MNVRVITSQGVTRRLVRFAPALLLALLPLTLTAQQQPAAPGGAKASWADEILKTESYVTPPPEVADAVLIPRYLNISLTNASPDKKWFVDEISDGPVLMKTFSKPFHELGGVFIDFKANRARALTVRNNIGIQIISAADGTKKALQIPAGARVSNATWSPDGKAVAYLVHTEEATHIWMTDIAANKPVQITKTPVLATLVSSFEFTQDGRQITAVLAPDARAPMPQAPAAPGGPVVKIADADKNRLRTFPSLMTTPHEKALLEWHATGQLAMIDVQTRTVRKVGAPAMIRSLDASPDGKYVRVTRMVKPFSYDVPVSNVGSIEEVWDLDGKALAKSARSTSGCRTTRSRPIPRPPPAAGAAAIRIRRDRASWRGAPTGRGSPTSSRSRRPRVRRRLPAADARRAPGAAPERATRRRAAAGPRRARRARTASCSGCRRSTPPARRCSTRTTPACRITASRRTCRCCS